MGTQHISFTLNTGLNENLILRAQQQLRWATVDTTAMGRKEGAAGPLSRELGPVQYNVAWAEVYFRTKRRRHPSSHLA